MMNYSNILSKYGLSKTKFRSNLVKLFYKSGKSLSIEDIVDHFNKSINKVTIYRSLEAFEKKGLIHQVPDRYNLKRFALCKSKEYNVNLHNHGHFICYSCSQTFCLDDVKIPELKNLVGFFIKESKLTLEGYCQRCRSN